MFRHHLNTHNTQTGHFYAEICDFRTAKDIGIDRPKKNEILHKTFRQRLNRRILSSD